jgi:hypothetical protein
VADDSTPDGTSQTTAAIAKGVQQKQQGGLLDAALTMIKEKELVSALQQGVAHPGTTSTTANPASGGSGAAYGG